MFAKTVEGSGGRGADVRQGGASQPRSNLPVLLTVAEAADLLRTSRRAIYVMIERHQLPGLTRVGRRVLFRADDLLDWLDQKRAPSLKE
jgi:excisionase family DNA binding protein